MYTQLLTSLILFFTLGYTGLYAGILGIQNAENGDKNKKFHAIIEHYEKQLQRTPKNLTLVLAIGEAYYTLKEYPKAIYFYQYALELDPENTKIKTLLAASYLANNDLVQSLKLFTAVNETKPNDPDVLGGLGRIEALKHHPTEAEQFYQQALAIDPNNFTILYFLADLRIEQKRYAEAQEILEKLLFRDPQASWIEQSLQRAQQGPLLDEIQALEETGHVKEAVTRYKELLAAYPGNTDLYLALGGLYMRTKRYTEAIKLFEEGIRINPRANPLHVALGFAYLAHHDLADAEQAFNNVLKRDPDDFEALAGLGRIAALEGRKEKAETLYQKSLEQNPNGILALSYLAQLRMEQKHYQEAKQLYEKILEVNPKETWAKQALNYIEQAPLLQKIEESEKGQDFKETERLYQQLLVEAPNNVDYYIQFGQFLVGRRHYQEAITLYLQGLIIQPKSITLQVALGFAYLKKGDWDLAENVFEAVLDQNSANAEALAGLGRIAELRGFLDDAESLYGQALKADPNNLTALTWMAELMSQRGQFNVAQKLFKKILRLEPSAEWVKLALEDAKHGRLIAEIKKREEAKEYKEVAILYRQLLLEAPDVPEYYLRAGLFYHRTKQYQEAIDTYLQGISIAPDSSELYGFLGLVYLSKKNKTEARKAFNQAIKLDPRNADALAGLGSVALLNKKFKKAETYIQAALTIDPNNPAALSSLGNLRMLEKRYPEAQEIFKKLMELQPNEKWIKTSYQNAKHGRVLDQIKHLIKHEQLAEAAQRYRMLITQDPDNASYYVGLGQVYSGLQDYSTAISVYLQGLKVDPEETELLVSLGHAYLLNKDLLKAKRALIQAIKRDAKNPETLAGLGRIHALEEDTIGAEELYRRALAISPINQSALTFYGALLMKQKRYNEARDIFTRLSYILPRAEWVQRSLQDAEDGPLTDLAQCFADREEFEAAAILYCQLVAASPNDPARYLPLGEMYVYLQQYCRGICVFREGLAIDPDNTDLWRAIASAYILLEEYCAASNILAYLLYKDPEDAESWAELGRIEAVSGSMCRAEADYAYALELDSENVTALAFLAALRQEQQYNFSALDLYTHLMAIDSRPKWVRRGYLALLDLTMPTLSVEGGYHEERQWDPKAHQWSAEYQVYGGRALLNYPIDDILTLWGRVADEFYVLKDLLGHFTIYSIDVQRLHVGAKWIYSPCFFIEARAGGSNFSRYRHGTFCVLTETIAEPALTFTYHQPIEKAVLSFSRQSNLVARNFNTNVAKLVGRYFILGSYERKVIKRGWIGVEGDVSWYRDFVHNTSQRVLGWFQWRPPCYSDNIVFRYHVKYQRFSKNIPDYYTYKDQIVNQLQLTLEKFWRVCWADSFYTSLSYGHGWQDTHTRFSQIITVTNPGVRPPLIWDRRQYNILFGHMIYKCDRLQLSLSADYYRDTEKYTMWSILAGVRWRF